MTKVLVYQYVISTICSLTTTYTYDSRMRSNNFCIYYFRKEDEVYEEWKATVDEVAKMNLEKPLLIRDPNTLTIEVNFDPQVCTYIHMYV